MCLSCFTSCGTVVTGWLTCSASSCMQVISPCFGTRLAFVVRLLRYCSLLAQRAPPRRTACNKTEHCSFLRHKAV